MAKKKAEECCDEEEYKPAVKSKASQVVMDVKPPMPVWLLLRELKKYQHLYDDLWYWDGSKYEKVREVCECEGKLVVK